MKVKNVLNEIVETMVCGFRYKFNPWETKDIYDIRHFNMFKKKKNIGLVALFYERENHEIYPTYEEYEIAKTKEALKEVHDEAKEHLLNEIQAANEMDSDKGTTTFEKDRLNIEKFEKRFADIEGQISDFVNPDSGKSKKGKKKSCEGQGSVKVESSANADEAAA